MTDVKLSEQLARMERAREVHKTRFRLRDEHVTMSHGSGGKASFNLIESLFVPAFADLELDSSSDSAVVMPSGEAGPRLSFTTDSYVVNPLFFAGGDIGSLAVHGTVNDLAVSGARPICLSVGLILEEGLPMDVLRRVVESMARSARRAGVNIVTGDTKVVDRGKADLLFINTSGIGVHDHDYSLGADRVQPGDRVLLSGPIGDHGMAVMLAREELDVDAPIESDSAPLNAMCARVLKAAPSTRVMKDPTRGGVATSLNEIAMTGGVAISIVEEAVPVRIPVRGACEILGIDPLHMANEGKLLAVVPVAEADAALEAMRAEPAGSEAADIGEVLEGPEGMVLLRTGIGGSRVLDMLVGNPLPRIC